MNILKYPNPLLLKKSKDVKRKDVSAILNDMCEAMYEANGCGLAAPQIGILEKIVVIDLRDDEHIVYRLINPAIMWKSDELIESDEGCLSLPGLRRSVKRHERVSVEYLNESFQKQTIDNAEGLLAVCLQHEIDHLYGKLFIDHLNRLERLGALREFKKLQQEAENIASSDIIR
jgi:peptide deformylase